MSRYAIHASMVMNSTSCARSDAFAGSPGRCLVCRSILRCGSCVGIFNGLIFVCLGMNLSCTLDHDCLSILYSYIVFENHSLDECKGGEMRYAATGLILFVSFAWIEGANAQTCSGYFGQNKTSFVFTGGNKGRYCFKTECHNVVFTGDINKEFHFAIGDRGAKMKMSKKDGGYYGNYYGLGSGFAIYRCR